MRRAALVLALALAACGHSSPKAPPGSTIAAKVHVGGQPCGVVAAYGAVWVTDAANATLFRIEHDAVTAHYPVDATPCELTSGYGALWVSTQSGKLDRVDPSTGRVVAHITVGATSYEPTVAFGSVWVTNRNGNSVSRVDPRTNRATTITTPFVNAGGIVAESGYLWIGDDTGGASQIVRMDPKTLVQTKIPAGDRPSFVAATPGTVWVANEGDGTVTRIDAKSGKTLGTVKAGDRPVNLATLPGVRPEVWVPDDTGNHLTRIDATTGEVVETFVVGTGPAVVAPDGTDIWVSLFGEGAVARIRPGPR